MAPDLAFPFHSGRVYALSVLNGAVTPGRGGVAQLASIMVVRATR
jgi:hypothetical protein